ncbi:cyclophilin-like fold protein [Kitasatospora purpeofusca]|uniref:cyclophilin-like fold protein n=1 Tax=Kitasatospora purpeofusca TaxID=67352 RepID=UPI002A5A203A|nr:cyclophilin-like fold protein [Kitasatospora purpeofusca]MDY0812993.1 cyclophilin-like fold protein [Kitasatospora purpeofusca]
MTASTARTLLRCLALAAVLLAATDCAGTPPATGPSTTATTTALRQKTPVPTDRSTPVSIRVTLDGTPVPAVLNDSPAARDLAALLPVTVDLEDFHGTERIGYPPRKLTTAGAPAPAAAKAGDIAYYAPWGNLALFHQDGPAPSPDLLILGHLDTDPGTIARAEKITVQTAPRPTGRTPR